MADKKDSFFTTVCINQLLKGSTTQQKKIANKNEQDLWNKYTWLLNIEHNIVSLKNIQCKLKQHFSLYQDINNKQLFYKGFR